MTTRQKRQLRQIASAELAAVRGGALLIPAVQKIRDPAAPASASTIYVKFEGIAGDATE